MVKLSAYFTATFSMPDQPRKILLQALQREIRLLV